MRKHALRMKEEQNPPSLLALASRQRAPLAADASWAGLLGRANLRRASEDG
jgi:hypothetical protein